ncbi:MAG: transporter [Novosphingobium sp.]
MRTLRRIAAALMLASVAVATPAYAGPPFVTDDPEPPEPGEIELITYVEGEHYPRHIASGEGGFDINYGLVEDVQIAMVAALGFQHEDGDDDFGINDLELGVKYRFAHQQEDGSGLDVALYPSVTIPTGENDFSSDKVSVFLPLWAQKTIGPWEVFGGGGYTLNPGAENKDYWSEAVAVTREVTPKLRLGGEIYHNGSTEVEGHAATGVAFGGEYALGDSLSLVGSGGPVFAQHEENGDFTFFVGLVLTH